MLRLRDIMTTDVAALAPETSIMNAMAFLSERHISGAPVMSGYKVLGVVSSTDLLAFASELSGLSTEPAEFNDDESEDDTTDETAVSSEPIGAFFHDMWTDGRASSGSNTHRVADRDWDSLGDHVVTEAMTHAVWSLAPGTPVELAAEFMRVRSIHRVLVMQEDRLLGIVTTRDIADAVAAHRLTNRTYLFA